MTGSRFASLFGRSVPGWQNAVLRGNEATETVTDQLDGNLTGNGNSDKLQVISGKRPDSSFDSGKAGVGCWGKRKGEIHQSDDFRYRLVRACLASYG